jgi:hypothetical protein
MGKRVAWNKGIFGIKMKKRDINWNGTPEERLMNKTRKTDTCWLWEGLIRNTGYGSISIDGKDTSTHRLAYSLFNGEITDNLCVLHKCDVRNCINPEHLFLGTISENNTDCARKGRRSMGENHHNNKLSIKSVKEIKKLLLSNISKAEIGRKYGVCSTTIFHISSGKTWKEQ